MRRVALLLALFACSCSGRSGSYVVSEAGVVPEAATTDGGTRDVAVDAASDAPSDAPKEAEAGLSTACDDFCATALNVGCLYDQMNDCLHSCQDNRLQFAACAPQYDAQNECEAAQPKSHWYCDTDNFAALDKHYCAAERSAYDACRTAKY